MEYNVGTEGFLIELVDSFDSFGGSDNARLKFKLLISSMARFLSNILTRDVMPRKQRTKE